MARIPLPQFLSPATLTRAEAERERIEALARKLGVVRREEAGKEQRDPEETAKHLGVPEELIERAEAHGQER